MVNWEELTKNLSRHGFSVHRFATAREAAVYLDSQIDGRTVGFGGSVTLQDMGLYELLAAHNTVHWNWGAHAAPDARDKATAAPVFLCSANALAETGEIVNIDGAGNRTCATLYGHEEIWMVIGANKVAPDYEKALWRARNIAGPKNAQRLQKKTPCALKADKCYDCDSPERICRGLLTLWRKPTGIPRFEIILVEEDLGF